MVSRAEILDGLDQAEAEGKRRLGRLDQLRNSIGLRAASRGASAETLRMLGVQNIAFVANAEFERWLSGQKFPKTS